MGSQIASAPSSRWEYLVSRIRMKFFTLLLCAGLSAAHVTKREAEADAEADPSYGHAAYATAPQCTLTPVKECNPRQVEKPRKVCQTVVDVHEDTVVHETCEEVVTTQCTQTSQTASSHTALVDKSTRLVETGVPAPVDPHAGANYVAPAGTVIGHSGGAVVGGAVGVGAVGVGYGHGVAVGAPAVVATTGTVVGTHSYHKREAEAEAEADAEADASYGYGAVSGVVAPVAVAHSGPQRRVDAPVCSSPPVKNCHKTPVSRPRKVARVVCDTIVDVTTIEDCVETVTKHCTSSSTHQSAHSAVVGHDSKVVASGEQRGVVGHSVGPAVVGGSYSAGSAVGATAVGVGAVGVGHGVGIGHGVGAVGYGK